MRKEAEEKEPRETGVAEAAISKEEKAAEETEMEPVAPTSLTYPRHYWDEPHLLNGVNTLYLREVGEGGGRYRGHILVTNDGNPNLLGPHGAILDEEGDGYYLPDHRHFYLKEAAAYTGVYYLLCGKAYHVEPVFDRDPKVGYESEACPVCGLYRPHHVVNCPQYQAEVCEDCCAACRFNHEWRCGYSRRKR